MTGLFLTLLLILPVPQSEAFTRFSFCRESPAGQYGIQCFELDSNGKGTFKFSPVDADTVEVGFEFSPDGAVMFNELLEDTDYLEDGDQYESGRRVANLGTKTIVIDGPWGQREAVFNYTTVDEAAALTRFFERLIAQEMFLFDVDIALEFDRLGIPDRLDWLEREIRAGRLADTGRVVALLERIERDQGLVNFARTTATRLKEDIEDRN
jgi:hypothetical protein